MRQTPVVAQTRPTPPKPARDLADFLLRWESFRPEMTQLQGKNGLTVQDKEILGWMIALTDRIRADDVV